MPYGCEKAQPTKIYPANPLIFFCWLEQKWYGQKYASNYHKKPIYNEVDISKKLTGCVCVCVRGGGIQKKQRRSNAIRGVVVCNAILSI